MTWGEPGWLFVLPLVAGFGVVLAAAATFHRRRLGRWFSPTLLRRVLPPSVRFRRGLRDGLTLVGLAACVVALAEPRFGKVVQTIRATGTDLVILLDLSRSMDAGDIDPSRLERARREISDLGDVIQGDRIGLVLFAGGAYPRLPLTADVAAIETVVREVDTSAFTTQGSDLATAIRVGLELLARSEDEAGQAMLVISDGEIHDQDDAAAAIQEAKDHGIPIFAMGIGVDAAPIPLPDGRHLQFKGKEVVTTPDFTVLEQAARATGGAFVRSDASTDDIRGLYGELRSTVRSVERESRQRETWQSSFQVPLGLAAFALLIGSWLGDGRRTWGAATAALLAALAFAPSTARAQDLPEADRLYREGKYELATRQLLDLTLAHPDDPDLQERLGAARYRAGDVEGAARAYEQAARLRGDRGAADDWFNGANANRRAGRLEKAMELYDRALAADPDHEGARTNRDLVQKEIAARRAERPPPPPPQPGGEQQQQPQQPQQQGQPQESQGQAEPAQGEPEPSEEGERQEPMEGTPDPEGTSGAVTPEELGEQTEGEPSSTADAGAVPAEDGPITPGQARRLLEGVEEGQPRTVVQARPESKPW
jgi:Ca-activated chloride channel family protein